MKERLNLQTEKFAKGIFLQWKRIIRFIIEYAEHSSCDFSYQYKITTFSSSAYDAVFSSICSREKNTNMISYLRSLLRFFDSRGLKLEQINDTEILNYITSKNTILRYEDRRYLKLFTEYLKEQKISDLSIDFSLWKIHEPRSRLIRPFSECEITQLLRYIREEASSGKRNEVMILTAVSTGLQGIDLVKLRLTVIDWKNRSVIIPPLQ